MNLLDQARALFRGAPNHENHPDAPVTAAPFRACVPCGDTGNNRFHVTCRFGWRNISIAGILRRQYHDGLDLQTWYTPTQIRKLSGTVFAIEPGVVAEVLMPDPQFPGVLNPDGTLIPGVPKGRGWTPYVKIQSDSGRVWVFRHVGACVKPGDRVEAGQAIGDTAKNYGFSTGNHLHLELWVNGRNVDPLPQFEQFGFVQADFRPAPLKPRGAA